MIAYCSTSDIKLKCCRNQYILQARHMLHKIWLPPERLCKLPVQEQLS